MTAKKKQFPALMTKTDVAEIENQIQYLEGMLRSEAGQKYISDKDGVVREIRSKKKKIDEYGPKKYKTAEGNKAYTRAKQLAENIRKKMMDSASFYQPYPKDSGSREFNFERAVNHEMKLALDKRYQDMVIEYQYHMKRLDPDDPTIGNVELLRDNKVFNKIFVRS